MHAMFGVVCFPELGRDTGRCETQIVVLSIVHETQTQNYNVTFFVRSQHENKQTKVSDCKTSIYTTFHIRHTSIVSRVVKVYDLYLGCSGFESDSMNYVQFWDDSFYRLGSAQGLCQCTGFRVLTDF